MTAIDHVMVGVTDLASSAERHRRLGFAVSRGGEHEGLGSVNELILFGGRTYVELMAVRDREAFGSGMFDGERFLGLLDRFAEVPTALVLANDDLDRLRERLARVGVAMEPPIAVQRLDDEGRPVRWRLLLPSGRVWRDPRPIFIEWLTDRHPADAAVPHANGALSLSRVTLAVPDLDAQVRLYGEALGVPIEHDGDGARVRVALGDATVELIGHGVDARADAVLDAGEAGVVGLEVRVAAYAGEAAHVATRGRPFELLLRARQRQA
ncbi:VOC family protein [Conexibacter woesei]|uniref:Glyoxalase-like domain-containing protein n=1 Tax=Conexibacter woesei (strain DSM 14684 / CCUG 47730 / CIP 108061 / JCM 11494 / NBRC 100937 / ID131577) TaxID=469383 RepID=D3F6Z2_CONWI|nr:VOC family protein [Conexibacter woesei]ADB52790.1 conserved hypothetical protein [Conexibacter woesei DSM 14684]